MARRVDKSTRQTHINRVNRFLLRAGKSRLNEELSICDRIYSFSTVGKNTGVNQADLSLVPVLPTKSTEVSREL